MNWQGIEVYLNFDLLYLFSCTRGNEPCIPVVVIVIKCSHTWTCFELSVFYELYGSLVYNFKCLKSISSGEILMIWKVLNPIPTITYMKRSTFKSLMVFISYLGRPKNYVLVVWHGRVDWKTTQLQTSNFLCPEDSPWIGIIYFCSSKFLRPIKEYVKLIKFVNFHYWVHSMVNLKSIYENFGVWSNWCNWYTKRCYWLV